MNLITEVKQNVDIVRVAEAYGIILNRAYKCKCPFHREETASFSISTAKQIWKCFGCGRGGDAISLVSNLLNVNAFEAAKSINYTLGLGLSLDKPNYYAVNKYKEKRKTEQKFKDWESETFDILCKYIHLLRQWKKLNNIDNPLYIEAVNNYDYVDYIIDEIFINGSDENKVLFWKNQKKWVREIGARVV